jgi:hypothetical protein
MRLPLGCTLFVFSGIFAHGHFDVEIGWQFAENLGCYVAHKVIWRFASTAGCALGLNESMFSEKLRAMQRSVSTTKLE